MKLSRSIWVPGLVAVACTAALAGGTAAPPPEAELRYLQNAGWLVRTPGHVLVFDYVDSIPGADPLPSGVAPDPVEFGDRQVMVFVTHAHGDHFSPAVFEWAARRPGIQYVLGWSMEGRDKATHVMSPREEWSSSGVNVKTTGSTDEGVGFLVTVDGLTLYHAGDHALWSENAAEAFGAEIQWLKAQGTSIDLAFFPVATGYACEPRPSIWKGVESAARELRPRVLVPMHVRCVAKLDLYEKFRAEVGPRLGETAVVAPAERGDRFRYAAGKLTRATPQGP